MSKNNVVIKEKDAWTNIANFIGEMVAKYADELDFDSMPNPDNYMMMRNIKQLYQAFHKYKVKERLVKMQHEVESKDVA